MCILNLKKKFGKKIKYYRELNGLTQEQLAELIDINCRSLSFIERGVNFVKADTIEKICAALNVSPKQLFDFEYSTKPVEDIKQELHEILDNNEEKINDIYKIVKGFTN